MKIRFIVIVFFIFLIVVVSSIIDSFFHGEIDSPQKSDVIIMLGGGDSGRMQKAAELYHAGYAEYVMITPVIESIGPQSKEYAVELGIPEEAVIEEYEATSTYTNATESLRLMDEYNFDSALVVTSDYHLKRSKMIFDRVSGGVHTLIYIAAYGPNGEAWHERDFTWRIWWSEFCKMWGYRLGLYQFVDLRDAADGVE